MNRTAAIWAAIALGVAGIVLGAVALARGGGGGGSAFEQKTLTLQGAKGTRVDFDAPILVKGNPAGVKGWEVTHPISGDATGEAIVTCLPLIDNDVHCSGGFQLSDGDIEIENEEHAHTKSTSAEGSIVGGSGAYAGAYGSYTVDWTTYVYTLHIWLPKA
jgi:hypothetical protein